MTYKTLHIVNNGNTLRLFLNSKGEIFIEVSKQNAKVTDYRYITIKKEDALELIDTLTEITDNL